MLKLYFIYVNMSLIPEKNSDFSKPEYWNSFFTKREATFEWYGSYSNLKRLLTKYIGTKDIILVAGCGNSNLSLNLYLDGFTCLTSIDNSEVVITNMKKKHKSKYPGLTYEVKNILDTKYPDEKYNVIIDKGTLDALMPDDEVESLSRVMEMFNEMKRTLKFGGRYICISLLQCHIAKFLFTYFNEQGWIIRVCHCTEIEDSIDFNGQSVFMVVCTKINKLPGGKSILEWNPDGQTNERLSSIDDLLEIVLDTQKSVFMCFNLTKCRVNDKCNNYCFEINCSQTKTPRYTIVVAEGSTQLSPNKMTFAAFIVPHGREHEWLFNSKEGQDILRRNCNVDRLAIVSMHRGQTYKNLEEVQKELSRLMLKIAPQGVVRRGETILFLSLEQQLGNRKTIVKGKSKFSGDYVVEEVAGQTNEIYRRLVFLDMPQVIQSEVKLIRSVGDENKIDCSYFISDYIPYLGLGIGIIAKKSSKTPRILLIGLGGGVLANLLVNIYNDIKVIALEIDDAVYKIAKESFGLTENSKLNVKICDGLEYLKKTANKCDNFDAVIYDIDVKDPTLGLSGPPKIFMTQEALNYVKTLIGDQGIFLINFICRATDVKSEIISILKTNFKNLTSLKITDEINKVLFASNQNTLFNETLLVQTADYLNQCAKCNESIGCDIVDSLALKSRIENY
ncbi:eEF1A lysine and N-terminal methyltransferase homolog [Daktulosphaira vitifoliae]|uniref:eEF1A lysine and N-terminal methyltransferase homolog n=1 Tax=Daktulosphaira vitifoliae TaxID=58002 RepID=UPI0021AAE071|nr:eEF1A lysine and N-terminal methyltransferase homolog [Daktulosphaira vitifoliae]